MNRNTFLAALAIAACTFSFAGGPAAAQTTTAKATSAGMADAKDYRLGAGDVIRISVFQNPDLGLETRVSETGVISFPLLGSVKIGGLTASEVEKVISDGLRNGAIHGRY